MPIKTTAVAADRRRLFAQLMDKKAQNGRSTVGASFETNPRLKTAFLLR